MRISNSYSASYRKVRARRHARKLGEIARLCDRLDKLVFRAEAMARWSVTRRAMLTRADRVREKLRRTDH